MGNLISDSNSIHSSPSSPGVNSIPRVPAPLNFYKNQFQIEKSSIDELKTETVFPDYVLHKIKFSNIKNLIRNLKFAVSKRTLNAIHATEEIFFEIGSLLQTTFPELKFVFTTNAIRNVTDVNEQQYLIVTEHQRAHRNHKENFRQLGEQYFFPKMKKRIRSYVLGCEICKKQKFDTCPQKQIMNATPIPTHLGEYLQIDIFHAGNKLYYSTIDRFSKFVIIRYAENKLNAHEAVEEILQFFPFCSNIMTDNESIFTSFPMKTLFQRKNIVQTVTPIRHSTTNSQIERFHRTIIEIGRCLAEQSSLSFEDVILDAVREYNNTIHSVINAKPIDVFFHFDSYPNIPELIKRARESMLNFQNKNRYLKQYEPGDIIFAKNNRRDKRSQPFTKHIVKENGEMIIMTDRGIKIHKDNIPN